MQRLNFRPWTSSRWFFNFARLEQACLPLKGVKTKSTFELLTLVFDFHSPIPDSYLDESQPSPQGQICRSRMSLQTLGRTTYDDSDCTTFTFPKDPLAWFLADWTDPHCHQYISIEWNFEIWRQSQKMRCDSWKRRREFSRIGCEVCNGSHPWKKGQGGWEKESKEARLRGHEFTRRDAFK